VISLFLVVEEFNMSSVREELAEATEAASGVVSQLTANLLRVARGAGSPTELPRQVEEAHAALSRIREVCPFLSAQDYQPLLKSALRPWHAHPGQTEREQLTEDVISASLRVVAARLSPGPSDQTWANSDLDRALQAFTTFVTRPR
jgi:hypothetical protein